MNHLTLGIYPSKKMVYNVVREEDLQDHIDYNLIFRPGRLLYVDGKRMNNGCMKENSLHTYDEMAKNFIDNNNINLMQPTIPYR